jgi:DNA-nicking Smr family endonuclease
MGRRAGKGPVLPDWHLWTVVKQSVTPLRAEPEPTSHPLQAARLQDRPLPLPSAAAPPVLAGRQRWVEPVARPVPRTAPPRTEPGVLEPGMRRRLMRGHIEIDATLDLHGLHQDEARSALGRFVPARAARGDRTLLIITGKGLKKTDDLQILDRGVLRAMLPVWLSEPPLAPYIAGWNSAAQGHGGEGAFYVRLRRVGR